MLNRIVLAVLLSSCADEPAVSYCPIDTVPCATGCCRLCIDHTDCADDLGCCEGVCAATCGLCDARQTLCDNDNECHDLESDFFFCGACDTSCTTQTGLVDTCHAGECVCGASDGPCTDGLTCCSGDCIDSDSSSSHCGDCDSPCLAPKICLSGSCEDGGPDVCLPLEVCPVGLGLQCIDTDTDDIHCGACNASCAIQFGRQYDACVGGECLCLTAPPCAEGEECTATGCIEVPCNPSTCPLGCCDGDVCREDVVDKCGSGAGACVDCATDFNTRINACVDGACVCQSVGAACGSDVTCTGSACELLTSWQSDIWGACSDPCGGGTQTRNVWCQSGEGTTVDDASCTEAEPDSSQPCNLDACLWATSDWDTCTATCEGGTQDRTVWCETIAQITVDDAYCTDTRPDSQQICNDFPCVTYAWETGNWGGCNSSCSSRTRSVWCEATPGGTVADSFCSGAKPATSTGCNQCCTPTLSAGSCISGTQEAQWFPWGNNNGGSADRASCANQCTSWASGQGMSSWCCKLYEDSGSGTTWVCRVYDSSTTGGSDYAARGTCP